MTALSRRATRQGVKFLALPLKIKKYQRQILNGLAWFFADD